MAKSKFDINKPIKVNTMYDRVVSAKPVINTLTKWGGVESMYFDVEIVYRKQTFKGIIYDTNLINNITGCNVNFVKKYRAMKKIFEIIIGKYQKDQTKLEL